MREAATTFLELAGAAVVTYGLWMFVPWVAVVFAGAALIAVGYLLAEPPRREETR